MAKIYVASSWRNPRQPDVCAFLRSQGHEVYDFRNPAPGNTGFAWSSIDPDWQNWSPTGFRNGLDHPTAQEGFGYDFDAMKWADQCVLVLPCGRSAHLEAGWCMGKGKPVTIYAPVPVEPELMYLLEGESAAICTNLAEVAARVKRKQEEAA